MYTTVISPSFIVSEPKRTYQSKEEKKMRQSNKIGSVGSKSKGTPHSDRMDEDVNPETMNLMNYIFIELADFNKTIHELETEQDVFLFLLKNFTENDKQMYDLAAMVEKKHRAAVKTQIRKAKENVADGIVKNLLQTGLFSVNEIADFTGLPTKIVRRIGDKFLNNLDF